MPLLMGYVIAPLFEDHLRRALSHARGDWAVLLTNPIFIGVLATAILIWALRLQGRRA